MTILRIQKHEANFVILDKTFVNDPNLSMQAKGLLTYLLSLPNNWRVNIHDLTKRFSNGKHAISSTINELIKVGYIERYRPRQATGKFASIEYSVHEQPISTKLSQSTDFLPDDSNFKSPQSENQVVEEKIPQPENRFVVNQPQPDFPAPVFPQPENQSLINNIYNKKTNNEEEATDKLIKFENTEKHNSSASTASFLSDNDRLIGEELTSRQFEYVTHAVSQLFTLKYFSCSFDEAVSAVVDTLCSQSNYEKAGVDFLLKLNIVKKSIQNRTWAPPVNGLVRQKNSLKTELTNWQQQREVLINKINNEDRNIEQFSQFKTLALQRNQSSISHELAIQNATAKRALLLKELTVFDKTKPETAVSMEQPRNLPLIRQGEKS